MSGGAKRQCDGALRRPRQAGIQRRQQRPVYLVLPRVATHLRPPEDHDVRHA